MPDESNETTPAIGSRKRFDLAADRAIGSWGRMSASCHFHESGVMKPHKTAVKSLGEIALRVNDIDEMQRFYEDVIGLEVMSRSPQSVFFRIAAGHAGHTQILVLFDRSGRPRGPAIHGTAPSSVSQDRSTLDHIALAIDLESYESEKERLESLGLVVETAVFEWVRWRSLFVPDPEGNTVELVCFDETIQPGTDC